jgi:hypothetical protein
MMVMVMMVQCSWYEWRRRVLGTVLVFVVVVGMLLGDVVW